MEEAQEGGVPAAFRWIAKAEIAVAGLLLLAALGITLVTILERNLGHSTGDWSLKLPELLLAWITFLGMGGLVTERGHVAADMFLRLFPPRGQRIAQTLSALVAGIVLAVILAGALSILRQQIDIGGTDEELWDIPEWILTAVLPVGLGITILHLALELWLIWRPGRSAAPQDPGRAGS
ncbi:MAG TPA: TRAP transporter small permease [Usitatibacter sp.]|nr:TRAP transporter small permease [Usitatibacter sp.]